MPEDLTPEEDFSDALRGCKQGGEAYMKQKEEEAIAKMQRCKVCKLPAYHEPEADTCYTCSYEKNKGSSGHYVDINQGITLPCSEEANEGDVSVGRRTYASAASHCLAAANTREAVGETAAAEVARSLAAVFRDLAGVAKRTGRVPQKQLELPFPKSKDEDAN